MLLKQTNLKPHMHDAHHFTNSALSNKIINLVSIRMNKYSGNCQHQTQFNAYLQ